MPAGYDAEVAELFRDLRSASGLSEADLAAQLATRPEVVQALEQGALYALPPWPETYRVVATYGTLLNLDVRPLLRRIYAQVDAGVVGLAPKSMPDVPFMAPPESIGREFQGQAPVSAPRAPRCSWRSPPRARGRNRVCCRAIPSLQRHGNGGRRPEAPPGRCPSPARALQCGARRRRRARAAAGVRRPVADGGSRAPRLLGCGDHCSCCLRQRLRILLRLRPRLGGLCLARSCEFGAACLRRGHPAPVLGIHARCSRAAPSRARPAWISGRAQQPLRQPGHRCAATAAHRG